MFLLWTGILDELSKFIAKINQVHPSIRFNFSYPSNSINFLETTIKKYSTGKLSTTLFKKETDCQALSSQKIRTPGVFKTQYSICLSPTSKINMHRRS